jgi:hypothetical protein
MGLWPGPQLDAPGVPSAAPCAPLSFTKSVPKYEKPGESPSKQWTADAGPATISEDITANTQANTIFFFFICSIHPLSSVGRVT